MKTHWSSFIPLIVFVTFSRICGTQSATACPWTYAFYAGAVVAIVQLLYAWYKQIPLDYIAVGTDAFLIYGAAAFLAFPALAVPYAYFRQTVIFLWILIVGVITTIVRPEGFLQHPSSRFTTKNVYRSLALMGVVVAAFVASFIFVKILDWGTFLGVTLPFIALLLARETLRKRL